MKSLAHPPA